MESFDIFDGRPHLAYRSKMAAVLRSGWSLAWIGCCTEYTC